MYHMLEQVWAYYKYGGLDEQALLDQALPMVELLWRRETEGQSYDSPERRAALDARLREALGKIGDQNLRGHYGQAIKERRAQLFAPAATGGPTRRDMGGARFGREGRGGFTWGAPTASAEVKSSALARSVGREAEARGREATMLLVLMNHPRLAMARFDEIEELDFLCRDLDELRAATLSALLQFETTAMDRDELIAEIEHLTGRNPVEHVLATPQTAAAKFAAADADEDLAEQGFNEILARHRGLIAFQREVAEAEAEMSSAPGEDVDRRLEAASKAHFKQSAPTLPETEDDDEAYSARLRNAIEGKIWEKKSRRRS